jgi:hypothetical protein
MWIRTRCCRRGCIRGEACTDGYGRSDAHENLRRHFEVDRFHIAQAEIAALAAEGKMTAKDVAPAIKLYKIDSEKPNPVGVRPSAMRMGRGNPSIPSARYFRVFFGLLLSPATS